MRRFVRFLAVFVLVPVLVAVLSAVSIGTWEHFRSRSKPVRTQIRLFNPAFDSTAVKRKSASKGDSGTCEASRVNPGVPEASRCFGGRHFSEGNHYVTYIYDPCWGSFTERLLCVKSPWDNRGTTFRVREWEPRDRRLPRQQSFRRSPPWALELSNGARCIYVSGASYTVAGMRANYFCQPKGEDNFNGAKGGWVVGTPSRSSVLWRALFAENQNSRSFKEVGIYVAWY